MVTTENWTSWWNDLNCDAHQDWICMIAKGKKPTITPVPLSPVPGNYKSLSASFLWPEFVSGKYVFGN